MKIEIESLDELRDLIGVMNPDFLRRAQPALGPSFRAADIARDVRTGTSGLQIDVESEAERYVSSGQFDAELAHAGIACETDGLPTDIPAPLAASMDTAVADTSAALSQEAESAAPTLDADGVPHNTDWHSEPAKINADGRWRARRKRDENAYKAWLLEQAVEVAEAAVAADAEPVATETHALPQDGPELHATGGEELSGPAVVAENEGLATFVEMAAVAQPAVDLAALVEASQEAALDASDSHMDLIKACQVFISEYGHPAYNALKAAVAPLEGAENGKAVPQFTPAERRLMRACIDKYPLN